MKLRSVALAGLAGLVCQVALAGQAPAATNIVYILDASNSMWGQIDSVAKIETAREAMGRLLGQPAEGAAVGLMAYGHRSEGDCADIELLAPIGEKSPDELIASLGAIKPKGKTPIAGALAAAGKVFPTNDAANHVVLISDGIETCDGDPCKVAGELAAAGVQTRIHAVGFDVDDEARAQLKCIAEAGKGSYFDAANAEEFRVAVSEATQVAQAKEEPQPEPEPVRERVFFDDFEGEMSEGWAINNPNPDAFIVEDGNLLMLSSDRGGFNVENSQNLFVLEQELPDGDWDAILTFAGEFKTGRDSLWFGLWTDPQNFLGAQFWTKRDCCGCSNIVIRNIKSSGGDETKFDAPIEGGLGCGSFSEDRFDQLIEPLAGAPATITLHKRGRSYHVSMDVGKKTEDGQPVVVETEKLTSLRDPGELAISIGKWDGNAQGEMLLFVDSVEIVTVEGE